MQGFFDVRTVLSVFKDRAEDGGKTLKKTKMKKMSVRAKMQGKEAEHERETGTDTGESVRADFVYGKR